MDTVDLYELSELDFNELENKITENPNLITTKDVHHRLLLHWCALKGRERAVEYLLSRNCPVDSVDETNNTPLILASLKGSLQVVEILIKAGANVNKKNDQGHSSLQYACSKGWSDVVKCLLEQNADVNVKDERGDTPLHRLASMGRTEILRLYLTNAVKPILDCPNREGNTPLHYACEDDESACALLLIEHGASPLVLNKEEKTPLDLCKPALRRVIKEKCGIE
ncbi:26S proteasome non-ATPase regulatory subunit 10 [Pseudolycoriella hygida]|uniref:26S proteasome non-ATPase regulatory subunit 10 n=1 Tax=Pseudolycoriella hygida TaxID=35572 RepID=A0A9Q0MW66_9DIPT|nr:26S proteasome non-ATPase regulatory subunit 10 [Pseudolycoriella hygida]